MFNLFATFRDKIWKRKSNIEIIRHKDLILKVQEWRYACNIPYNTGVQEGKVIIKHVNEFKESI